MDITTNIIIKVVFNMGLLAIGALHFGRDMHSVDTQFGAIATVSCS